MADQNLVTSSPLSGWWANLTFQERVQIYDFEVDLNKANHSHTKLLRMVGRGKRVLEIGCATGGVSTYLMKALDCEVTGIELNPEAASMASAKGINVIVGDVEKDALDRVSGPFDVITFGDVLEHLVAPGIVLRRAGGLLSEHGCILVSIPNVAHYRVRCDLLFGKFDYQEQGLLDKTHLRFFTLRTARQMIEESGYGIQDFDAVYAMRGARFVASFPRIERFLKAHLAELVGFQFIFKAAKIHASTDRPS